MTEPRKEGAGRPLYTSAPQTRPEPPAAPYLWAAAVSYPLAYLYTRGILLYNGFAGWQVPAFAAACIAASSAISVVIPPSTTLIVYGVMAGVSVGDLYLAGFAPGILMGALMCGGALFISTGNRCMFLSAHAHFGSRSVSKFSPSPHSSFTSKP